MAKKPREFSFTVTMNDEDLENFGYDPKLITDEEFQEIVENVEIIFHEEDHWAKIFVQACREVLEYDVFGTKKTANPDVA